MFPDSIKMLDLTVDNHRSGQLLHQSRFEFRYLDASLSQTPVGLLMPPSRLTYEDSALFPVMDQNLPEGDLFMRLRQMFPKQPLTAMHLLALSGANGIGRLGFSIPGSPVATPPALMSRAQLLATPFTLSDRKYHGSYERIAEALKMLRLPEADLQRFFEQVAFTVMASNGDGHLKNYGVLYKNLSDVRLAPMFDVVTTSIYRYARLQGGEDLEDRTMALKLFAGKGQTRTYPTTDELVRFGREVCRVQEPRAILRRIADAMSDTLAQARQDERIPATTLSLMTDVWASGMTHAA